MLFRGLSFISMLALACGSPSDEVNTTTEQAMRARYTMLFDAKFTIGTPATVVFAPRHPEMNFTPAFINLNSTFTVQGLTIAGTSYPPISGKGLHDLTSPLVTTLDTVALGIVYDGNGSPKGTPATFQASVIGFVP